METPTQTETENTQTTTQTTGVIPGDSQIVGISVRAWIAMTLVVTVCTMSFLRFEVMEPLYSALLLTLGFYFGQKVSVK